MSKTIKSKYKDKLTFEKLLEAHIRASKNKRNKNELLKFEINLETNIINILESLKNNTYKLGKYYVFKVYEPKERTVKALPYKDRIVQQWYIEEFIKPYILPRFINDSYACIPSRGTHGAVYQTQKYMRLMKRKYGNYYIIKGDISKFFYSIDKDILYKIMSKYIKENELLNLTKLFIYDNDELVGIPIGNYTSQYFANIYLNELDKYIKEELKVKHYIRYMDNFIILKESKKECIYILKQINEFINNKLHLKLNSKTRIYPNKMGINFCGYRIFETHILLRVRSKKKINKDIKKWNYLYKNKKLDINKMILSWNSWVGHASHANSYKLINKMHKKIIPNMYLME